MENMLMTQPNITDGLGPEPETIGMFWHAHWNIRLMLMSLAISSFGSFMCLQMITLSSFVQRKWTKLFFIGLGGISLAGCGIWLMHFTGMLAMSLETGIQYNWWKTLISLAVALVCCTIGAVLVLFPIVLDTVTLRIANCFRSVGRFLCCCCRRRTSGTPQGCTSTLSSSVHLGCKSPRGTDKSVAFTSVESSCGSIDRVGLLSEDMESCGTQSPYISRPETFKTNESDVLHTIDLNKTLWVANKDSADSVVMNVDEMSLPQGRERCGRRRSSCRRGSIFGNLGDAIDADIPMGGDVEAVTRRWFMILDRLGNGTLKNEFYSNKSDAESFGGDRREVADDMETSFVLSDTKPAPEDGSGTDGSREEGSIGSESRATGHSSDVVESEVSLRAKESLAMWGAAKRAFFNGKAKTFSDMGDYGHGESGHGHHGGSGASSQLDVGSSFVRTTIWFQIVQIVKGLVSRDVLVGGPIVAAGGFGMHYLGMNSMYGEFEIRYNMNRVILSAGIALFTGIAALAIVRAARRTALHLLCALVMGFAVCLFHYTAMSGCSYVRPITSEGGADQMSVGLHDLLYHRTNDHVHMIDGSGEAVQTLLGTVAKTLSGSVVPSSANSSSMAPPTPRRTPAGDTSVLIGAVTCFTGLLTIFLQIAMSFLIEARTHELEDQKRETERLLLSILPTPVARRMKAGERQIHEDHRSVSILFADIVGFTELSSKLCSSDLVFLLNSIFSIFDDVANSLHLTKIKTIGDCYMLAGGLPYRRDDHAQATVAFGLIMLRILRQIMHSNRVGINIDVRIGVHSGSVTAGVIGKQKFLYDVWGDTVNVASRMESSGKPGRVHVSNSTYEYIKDDYTFERRDSVPIKGKGIMTTYLINEECPATFL